MPSLYLTLFTLVVIVLPVLSAPLDNDNIRVVRRASSCHRNGNGSNSVSSSSTAQTTSSATTTAGTELALVQTSATSTTAAAAGTTAAANTGGSAGGSSDAALSSAAAQWVSLHTNFRKEYGAGPVTWNNTLATFASNAAHTCHYGHTGGPYGENVAAGYGGGYDATSGFNSWANEASKYDWNSPGYSDSTGHFTQIVWKATNQIGCSAVTCTGGSPFSEYTGSWVNIICEYYPRGNIVGDNNKYFIENVGKKVN